MERICTIALVAAAILTVGAALLDVAAIADPRQNGFDTAAIITSMICPSVWLFCGISYLQGRQTGDIDASINNTRAKTRTDAVIARRRLAFDPPTQPLTAPVKLRRVQ